MFALHRRQLWKQFTRRSYRVHHTLTSQTVIFLPPRHTPLFKFFVYARYPAWFKPRNWFFFFRKFKRLLLLLKSKCFFLCKANQQLTKKSQQARMGKGVGKPFRLLYQFNIAKPIFIIYLLHPLRFTPIRRLLQRWFCLYVFWRY